MIHLQSSLPRTMGNAPIPPEMRSLPRNAQGYPIPWFVATLDDGTRDFRVADAARQRYARQLDLCWVCGRNNGSYKAFLIGPMCAVNKVSAEPPGHLNCATYSARCCPFMATPQMVRRDTGLPADMTGPAGVPIMRNPGVGLVWVTRSFSAERAPAGGKGYLWHLGPPTSLHWYREGRAATRAEVIASMESGLPALQEACLADKDPEYSRSLLTLEYAAALALAPAA